MRRMWVLGRPELLRYFLAGTHPECRNEEVALGSQEKTTSDHGIGAGRWWLAASKHLGPGYAPTAGERG